jgi:hypothetical protein
VVKESYLQLLTAGVLFFYAPNFLIRHQEKFNPKQAVFDKVFSCILLIVCLGVYPIVTALVLFAKEEKLLRPRTQTLYGEFWDENKI